jgi:energy-coupling factor transporter ATP-binding protein EcfA2
MLNESELAMHALVFGSTGSGKSKTLESLAGSLLDLGWEGMIVDLKEDTKPGGLRDWCYQYATNHAVPYQELRLSDPNPA